MSLSTNNRSINPSQTRVPDIKQGVRLPGMSTARGNLRSGVSIIFKIRVFYKARFEGFEFFIRWPYAVFHKMQVVFYKSAHFMYL